MAKQVQLRRGTAGETALFAGALAEVTVDETAFRAVVHDGVTLGGHPLALLSEIVTEREVPLPVEGDEGKVLRVNAAHDGYELVLLPSYGDAILALEARVKALEDAANATEIDLGTITPPESGEENGGE